MIKLKKWKYEIINSEDKIIHTAIISTGVNGTREQVWEKINHRHKLTPFVRVTIKRN